MNANYDTVAAAIAGGRPADSELYRLDDGTYEWITHEDANEYALYGHDFDHVELTQFVAASTLTPPAVVSTFGWFDPDNG